LNIILINNTQFTITFASVRVYGGHILRTTKLSVLVPIL